MPRRTQITPHIFTLPGVLDSLECESMIARAEAGGDTRFQDCSVAGKTGMALVFEHGLIHQGAEISDGLKYVLRSDVMYGPIGQFRG